MTHFLFFLLDLIYLYYTLSINSKSFTLLFLIISSIKIKRTIFGILTGICQKQGFAPSVQASTLEAAGYFSDLGNNDVVNFSYLNDIYRRIFIWLIIDK